MTKKSKSKRKDISNYWASTVCQSIAVAFALETSFKLQFKFSTLSGMKLIMKKKIFNMLLWTWNYCMVWRWIKKGMAPLDFLMAIHRVQASPKFSRKLQRKNSHYKRPRQVLSSCLSLRSWCPKWRKKHLWKQHPHCHSLETEPLEMGRLYYAAPPWGLGWDDTLEGYFQFCVS